MLALRDPSGHVQDVERAIAVSGASVVCPLHAWKVDLHTGLVQRPTTDAGRVATYATRVDDGVLLVEL